MLEGAGIHLFDAIRGDYFRTMQVPLKRGRLFDASDLPAGTRTVVVNEAMAKRFLSYLPTNVWEMPTRVQAKLHRVLRDREAVLTDRARVELDIRPIAAVEPGFENAVEEGRLRRDCNNSGNSHMDLC